MTREFDIDDCAMLEWKVIPILPGDLHTNCEELNVEIHPTENKDD